LCRSIEPTLLLNPPLDSDIMTEEIFGPLLPIITVKKIEDSIKFLKSKPKPLAIYAFTRNEKLKQRIIDETSSGSVTFNDAIVQVRNDNQSILGAVADTDLFLLHCTFFC
jgi:aldehyde dehydrogenase (NAD+)